MADMTIEIRAMEWWKDNPDVRAEFTTYALDQAAHERRISVQYLSEIVRAKDRVNRRGDPCKLNNNWRPIIARLLVRQYPQIRPYIELRKSNYDHLLGGGE